VVAPPDAGVGVAVVEVVDGQGERWPLPRLPVELQSTWLSTCSTPPGPVVVDVVAAVAGPEAGPGAGPGPGVVGPAGVVAPPAPAVAVAAGPFCAPGTVVVVEARAGVGVGAGGFAGERPGAAGRAEFAGAVTPRGIAAGGGTAPRRPAPVNTPAKNRSEAPRTATAAFTYDSTSASTGAASTGAAKR
jgi:hypothetical protein